MHQLSVPPATGIHDAALEMSGNTTFWNSIIINILKPIASGRTSPTSLERSVLDTFITECQNLHAFLGTIGASGLSPKKMLREVQALYRSRIILRDRIERCSIAAAPGPIRRLPPEIMSEIFHYCLPEPCRPDPSAAPLLLCRVSSLWRDIAYATRRLWNRLEFTSQRKPNLRPFIRPVPSDTHYTSPLYRWLSHTSRSRIAMSFNHPDNVVLPDLVDAVLLPNMADLHSLTVHLPLRISHSPFHRFFALPPHALPSLKYLILTQGLPARATVFQASPRLTHLLLDDLDFAASPHQPGEVPTLQPVFPWAQITHLKIMHCMELELWVSALSSCRTLEVGSFLLDLRGLGFDPGYNGNDSNAEEENGAARVHVCGSYPILMVGEPVVLPFLKELDLIVGCGQSFPLKEFRFPALKTLRFHREHMPHVPPYQHCMIASQPDTFSWKGSLMFLSALESLNTLSLVGSVGSVEEIMILFRHIPTVSCLDLNLQVDYLAVFHALMVDLKDPLAAVLIPRLGRLRLLLESGDTWSFPEHALHTMVQSRVGSPHGVSILESLTIATNTFQKGHLDIIKNIANSTNVYRPTNVDVDLNASRAVPWKRCANSSSNIWGD